MEYSPTTILITGRARPSKEDTISVVHHMLFLAFIIDKETDLIVDATCNMTKEMAEKFIVSFFLQKNLVTDIDSLIEEISQRYYGRSQKTLIVALKDAYNQYMMFKEGKL